MTAPAFNPSILSTKQHAIMQVVLAGNGKDEGGRFQPCDLDELLSRLEYATTKQSIQFSIRALIKRGYITRGEREMRRGRSRVTIIPTDLAWKTLGSVVDVPFVEPVAVQVGSGAVQDSVGSLLESIEPLE